MTITTETYNKYINAVTVAFKNEIHARDDGTYEIHSRRTTEREKHLLQGFKEDNSDEIVLIECPLDVLAIEFEEHNTIKIENSEEITSELKNKFKFTEDSNNNIMFLSTRDDRNTWINTAFEKAQSLNLQPCIASHNGKSDYLYLFNITGLIDGREIECKKHLCKMLLSHDASFFVDWSNLSRTLIPIIGRPHWKFKKYLGHMHEVIKGTLPSAQYNDVSNILAASVINEVNRKDKTESRLATIIKSSVKLLAVMKKLNFDTSKNPTSCLWHGSEGQRCFSYSEDKNLWHCFHCGAGGDAITLVSTHLDMQFLEACSWLKKEFNIVIDVEHEIIKKNLRLSNMMNICKEYSLQQPIYYDKNKLYWLWSKSEKKWMIVDEIDVLNSFCDFLGVEKTYTISLRTAILTSLQMIGRRSKPLDLPATWIQFKNVFVDFQTLREYPIESKYFALNPIPWNYTKNTETPYIDKLFKEWINEKSVLLHEIIAFCIAREYFVNRIFLLLGSGRNGKSTFLLLLKKFIGADNCVSSELDYILVNRFETAKLYKKLACIMGETNFNTLKSTSILKKLSGQDLVGFEFKNKNPFDEVNYSKIIIATNSLAITLDKTDGFYRRWLIVDFLNKFDKESDVLTAVPDIEFENLCKKSVLLLNKLYRDRVFSFDGSIEEKKKRYEDRSNPLLKFIDEHYSEEQGCSSAFHEFYVNYRVFLNDTGQRIQSKSEVLKLLENESIEHKLESYFKDDGTRSTRRIIYGLIKKNNKLL